MHKLTVIWTRFSSEMQRPASCVDQERKARQGLDAKDIDHSHAKVFRVEAESGTKTDGAQFDELMQMIQRGEIAVLAVDDQGRFTRSDLAFSMILDLVYNGGRFISVGEGIDTDEPGWELKVKVLALHHSTSNRELARRVRRGQEGRGRSQRNRGVEGSAFAHRLSRWESVHQHQREPGDGHGRKR